MSTETPYSHCQYCILFVPVSHVKPSKLEKRSQFDPTCGFLRWRPYCLKSPWGASSNTGLLRYTVLTKSLGSLCWFSS